MQSTARPKALTGDTPRPPSSREGNRRNVVGARIARPPIFRAFSKPRIQLRVQGRNPARFKGGYGVPRGFKGEKSKSPPNPLGLAERVPSSADDDSPVFRNLVRGTNSFHRLRAVPLPRGGRSGGAGKRLNQIPSHMPDMHRVHRAYDFFCFRKIPGGRNRPGGGKMARTAGFRHE